MHFLLVNQFYPPDMAPTGQHLHGLARRLVNRGHEVTVVCSRRSYDGGGGYSARETIDGVAVRRLSAFGFGRRGVARAVDYLSFHVALIAGAWDRRRYDVALALTTPPFVGWTLGRSLGLRARIHANWVMDLYPDVLVAHGAIAPRGMAERALRWIARQQLSRTRLVVALGPRMLERVAAYATPGTQLEWIALWGTAEGDAIDAAAVLRARAARGWKEGECALLYSGNMGLGHRLGEFLEAAARLGPAGPVWAFAGGGVRRAEVECFALSHSTARVQLLPYVPQTELAASLAAADVHLVSLRDEWKGLIVPSKLQAAFGAGRPVIYVGPRDSEAADWILESGGGWVIAEGDLDGLLRAVREALDEEQRLRRGAAALGYSREHFGADRNGEMLVELLEAVARDRRSSSGRCLS